MGFESPSFEETPQEPVHPGDNYTQEQMDRYVTELAAYRAQQAALESQNVHTEQAEEQLEMSPETISLALEEGGLEFDNPDLNNKDFRRAVEQHDRKIDDDVAAAPGKYANWTDLVRKAEEIEKKIN